MPVDDSFLEKEAARRRAFTLIILFLMFNCLVFGALFAAGFRFEDPQVLFFVVVGEAVVCGLAYVIVLAKYGSTTPKVTRRR